MDKLSFADKIPSGEYRGRTVQDIIDDPEIRLITLIKVGFEFTDDVLKAGGIRTQVRDVQIKNEVVQHIKDNRVYAKEVEPISKILRELETINYGGMVEDSEPEPKTQETFNNDDYE